MNDGHIVFVLVILLPVAILTTIWTHSRGRRMLEEWAIRNGYRILESEYRWVQRGPYLWTSSKGQAVYYATIATPDGVTRNAWIRCGSFWLGIFTDKVEARWDE